MKVITNGCSGQTSAVTFCAKKRTKAANKSLLGEPGVSTYETEKNPNDRDDCLYSSCGTNLGERGQKQ